MESTLSAARRTYGDELIPAPGHRFHPSKTYAETHFALAAILLGLARHERTDWLDLAEQRLRLWNSHDGPATFFNAMAVCLAAITLRRAGATHPGLQGILTDILTRTPTYRRTAFGEWCGNNCYLQQVAVDLILLPLARGDAPEASGLEEAVREFKRYQTQEGFFFDLPRIDDGRDRQAPPTYIMKMLFLLGICHEFSRHQAFAELFSTGMEAVRPWITRDGNFSYFGRTDNSPFAAGLTIFNLRKAAELSTGHRGAFLSAGSAAELFYLTFPRTRDGLLACNRFRDPASPGESDYSKDHYAKIGEYSVASSAYAVLAVHCFPRTTADRPGSEDAAGPSFRQSRDLGLVRLTNPAHDLILRTLSDAASWDRRYLGPTVLRLSCGSELLIGAISKTVSTDPVVSAERSGTPGDVVSRFRRFCRRGFEQLDPLSVGFMPLVRHRGSDYLPLSILAMEHHGTRVTIDYQMGRLRARGIGAFMTQLREQIERRSPRYKPAGRRRPEISVARHLRCTRTVELDGPVCRIIDVLSGRLRGKEVCFSTRLLNPGIAHVAGLDHACSLTGWGSDGRQSIEVYRKISRDDDMTYTCEIGLRDGAD